jgi:hypothetical protein
MNVSAQSRKTVLNPEIVKTARRQGEFPDHRAFLLTQRNEIKPAIKDALADTASATHLTKKEGFK